MHPPTSYPHPRSRFHVDGPSYTTTQHFSGYFHLDARAHVPLTRAANCPSTRSTATNCSPTLQSIGSRHRVSFTRKLLDPEQRFEHFNEYERGGHFPAMEVPELLLQDLRSFYRRHR